MDKAADITGLVKWSGLGLGFENKPPDGQFGRVSERAPEWMPQPLELHAAGSDCFGLAFWDSC